jgi:rare lipoprotein A
MRSRADVIALLALARCAGEPASPPPAAPTYGTPDALPSEAGTPSGPNGTAGAGTSAAYDAVGYASRFGDELEGQTTASGEPFASAAVTAAHRSLPMGSYAEVTALDTGRTILVRIVDRGPGRSDREIDLSTGAARALGLLAQPLAPVRVRAVTPGPADVAALREGRAAALRLDAPEAVLRALRRQLPAAPNPVSAEKPTPRPMPTRRAATPVASPRKPAAAPAGRYLVQVAALSSAQRAQALARSFGGTVVAGGGIYRVRLGPFADRAAAQRARDVAAARGYGDASIIPAS